MLQKNERLVLRHLIPSARTSDSSIAEKIGITTQAVGKIRRKLEEQGVIMGYQVMLNHTAVGVNLFTMAQLRLSPELLESKAFKKEVNDDPHITGCMRHVHGPAHLHLIYAFKNLQESNNYFMKLTKTHPGIQIVDVQPITWDLVWKLNREGAFLRALED